MANEHNTHVKDKGDPLASIRGILDGMKEKQDVELKALCEKFPAVEKKFAEYEARIIELEDKAKNPAQRFYQSEHATREDRVRVVSEWMQNNYRSTNRSWGDSETGIAWRTAQEESTDSKGGYLVPTEFLPEILRIVGEFGVARSLCRIIPMQRMDMDISKKNAGPTISWPDEGIEVTPAGVTFGTVKLTAKKLMALDEVTLELRDDSAVDLASYLIDIFSEAVAEEEDKQAFNSTAPFTGLCQNTDIPVYTLATTSFTGKLGYDDFVMLMHTPDKNVRMRGSYLFSSDVFAEVQKIKNSQGTPLFNPGLAAGAPGTILGRPYVVSHVMPGWANDGANKPVAAYGDFRRYLLGDRRTMTVDFSAHYGFGKATEAMRVLERVAFACGIPAAFALMKTHS